MFNRLFKHGWDYHLSIIDSVRNDALNHKTYDKKNKKLLNSWQKEVNNALNFVKAEKTKVNPPSEKIYESRITYLSAQQNHLDKEFASQNAWEERQARIKEDNQIRQARMEEDKENAKFFQQHFSPAALLSR